MVMIAGVAGAKWRRCEVRRPMSSDLDGCLDLGLTRCRRSFGWVRSADRTLAGVGSDDRHLEKMEYRILVLRWCTGN
ncbi:hypothetical protein ACLOJK_004957, partial [Asimina triloba]